MTLPSAIFSRALVAVLVFTRICCAETVSGTIDLKRADRRDVVVWLEPLNAAAFPAPAHHARMVQKDKRFHPHVLALSTGTAVDFPNADPIFHNAFSNFNGQIFDIGLYPPGKSRTVVFRNPGIVRVFCNIHPAMAAVIVVVTTPYFTTSDLAGRYSIQNVPAGEYRMRVFDERATADTLSGVTRQITVGDAPVILPPISISEAGFILSPHSNKYGKAYPPGADDSSSYTIPQ